MLFNSIEFAVFFPIVIIGLFTLPQHWRRYWLLAASLVFYMSWSIPFVLLIFYTTTIDYFVAKRIAAESIAHRKKLWLALSLSTNFGVLIFFKYANFFLSSVSAISVWKGGAPILPLTFIILPIGISFYTFEAVSYTIDVYRGVSPAEKNYLRLLLFILFFPKLIAGPIERARHLIPQFDKYVEFDEARVVDGLRLMLWGFFKKMVIADRLAGIVDQVFNMPSGYTGASTLVATYMFAFQIFCDFSAYSDIAIGAARIMGFDLFENFRRPYAARTIQEFWQRWHISLSTWFRDYVYLPLGGSRVTPARWYLNIAIVFLVSGLWHGANWTFVVWGALHGAYMIGGVLTRPIRTHIWEMVTGIPGAKQVRSVVAWGVTFHLTVFAWIFFRANTLSDAVTLVRHLFSWPTESLHPLIAVIGHRQLMIAIALVAALEFIQWLERRTDMRYFLTTQPTWIRWPTYYGLGFAIVFLGVLEAKQFIYFQF
jgi:alginate O-acetyltransferase complex protein AlgI